MKVVCYDWMSWSEVTPGPGDCSWGWARLRMFSTHTGVHVNHCDCWDRARLKTAAGMNDVTKVTRCLSWRWEVNVRLEHVHVSLMLFFCSCCADMNTSDSEWLLGHSGYSSWWETVKTFPIIWLFYILHCVCECVCLCVLTLKNHSSEMDIKSTELKTLTKKKSRLSFNSVWNLILAQCWVF